MPPLVNRPADFASESIMAFAQANADRIRHVPGGVVRRDAAPDKVAIVLGGGSGHHPAFAGWVGHGLGDAAVCGNVFASPSAHQVLEVARAADRGRGVLFVPINYAGDILHFGAARDDLRGADVDARTVVVADDIASGGSDERDARRGIAGSLIVVKVAGAAAERGGSIDEVERVARAAAAATRSFGVAFSGCVLPGSAEPLFIVPPGAMAVGMGIHGEPGIAEMTVGTASEVADVLVDGLLAERPAARGQRVAVVVNGLGSTKYDELNLVFARASARLQDAGMALVSPLVGEYMTSLDMAGVSLSIAYLDAELEDLWCDAVDSVAFSRGRVGFVVESAPSDDGWSPHPDPAAIAPGSPGSRAAAARIAHAFASVRSALEAEAAELGRLDAIAGDGDHGMGMVAGVTAACEAAEDAAARGAGAGMVLRIAGEQWSAVAGGTSGALWGVGLVAAGVAIGDADDADAAAAVAAVTAFAEAIVQRGGAQTGDKTMIDAVLPFADALGARVEAGDPVVGAWRAAADAATRAAADTARLVPRRGRARIHESASLGTPDAGAVSFALVVRSALR
jgi:dihydroxyacetone kinase